MGRKPKKATEQFLPGDIISVYLDYHHDEKELAKVELIEKVKEATPSEAFIVKETSVLTQEVHSLEHWKVRIIEPTELGLSFHMKPDTIFTRRVKVLLNVGLTPSGTATLQEVSGFYDERTPYYLIDNFEGVPGWGQQF